MKQKVNIFWLRRDLRLSDNCGLSHALNAELPVLPVFIYDTNIISQLPKDDARITFINETIASLNKDLKKFHSGILTLHGNPKSVFENLLNEYDITTVYANEDYEPYSRERDKLIDECLNIKKISFRLYKDHVIFHKSEITKDNGTPYHVFTPYARKWQGNLNSHHLNPFEINLNTNSLLNFTSNPLSLRELGFIRSNITIPENNLSSNLITNYTETRNKLSAVSSHLSIYLRYGLISIRRVVTMALANKLFLKELIWREFFTMIIYHYPEVSTDVFNKKFKNIKWRNNENDFDKWCKGKTGFPLVDAGMRELNSTGFMHNRVRMVAAGFLVKQLLIDYKWGEAYFAEKLLDYDLAINNGNWQWVAGTGTDAAPYFRIFNPDTQLKKFDPELKYIKKWVPEYGTHLYVKPITDLKIARQKALKAYSDAFIS